MSVHHHHHHDHDHDHCHQGRLGEERPSGELCCQETPLLQTQCDKVYKVCFSRVLYLLKLFAHIHDAPSLMFWLWTIKMLLIERASQARRLAQTQAVTTVLISFGCLLEEDIYSSYVALISSCFYGKSICLLFQMLQKSSQSSGDGFLPQKAWNVLKCCAAKPYCHFIEARDDII